MKQRYRQARLAPTTGTTAKTAAVTPPVGRGTSSVAIQPARAIANIPARVMGEDTHGDGVPPIETSGRRGPESLISGLSPQLCESLRQALAVCVARADRAGCEQLLAVRTAVPGRDPLALFASRTENDRFFWQRPAAQHGLAALGCVRELDIDPARRFESASRGAQELLAELTVVAHGDTPALAGPLLVGGFAFSASHEAVGEWRAFPSARLLLPELLLVNDHGRCHLTICCSIAPGQDIDVHWRSLERRISAGIQLVEQAEPILSPAPAGQTGEAVQSPPDNGAGDDAGADRALLDYRLQIELALQAIASGQLEKVVLARSLEVRQPGRVDLTTFLDLLRTAYPGCGTFGLGRGPDYFVAASPERLVALDDGHVETGALAGTAPRGSSPEQDRRLGLELQNNAKERAEHLAVLRAIRTALEDICDSLHGPALPEVLRIEGIQHLHTPLRGQLRDGATVEGRACSILDLVGRLHPTPAVGGLPRQAALDWIRRGEPLTRGWYAGPMGFVDVNGDGEFWVALRSALFSHPGEEGATARLFAGAGIVSGSQPERELRETHLKLRALLAPLTETRRAPISP